LALSSQVTLGRRLPLLSARPEVTVTDTSGPLSPVGRCGHRWERNGELCVAPGPVASIAVLFKWV